MAKNAAKKKYLSVKKRLFSFLIKLGITVIFIIAFYGIYLDGKIRAKMDGQIWQLPAEVYGQIPRITQAAEPTFAQVKKQLIENGYRQTSLLAAPGDFKIEQETIVLIRRAFTFPDRAEPQRVLRLRFQQQKLAVIEDLVMQKVITEFRLSPKLIAMLNSENEERLAIPLQQYPRFLIDTLILTEDRHFFTHDGVSFIGIMRALVNNLKAGHTVQGGSTITQQLVKNLFLSNERTLTRKFNEIIMAIMLDAHYDKNHILETYLNEIYLGQSGNTQIHGFALASQFYFGRPIQEISLDQIALLVGMVKGPSIYNPWRNPENAKKRRNTVLQLMLQHNIIDNSLYQMLSQRPLGVQSQRPMQQAQPGFMQAVRQELNQLLGNKKLNFLSGAKIFTTLDPILQEQAESAIIQGTTQLKQQHQMPDLEAAMIIANYHTGEIQALVSGTNVHYAGFNRVLSAKRQIGSLVKPSIYLTALSYPERFALNTPIKNQPISIPLKGQPAWQPRNYDRKYSGSVLLLDALVRSLNIPTVNIGMAIGLDNIIRNQKSMGWDQAIIPRVPSMLLGSYAISPYDVTKLYQVIANKGAKIPLTTIRYIVSRDGHQFYQRTMNPEQVVAEEATIETLFAMQQVVERGTARSLQPKFSALHLAGKTGTTNDGRDTWFVGIDGNHITTVWAGLDNNRKTKLTGASGALQIYKTLLPNIDVKPLTLPFISSLKWVPINNYGGWACQGGGQTIPVWINHNPCASTEYQVTEPQPSIWDALQLNSNDSVDEATDDDLPTEYHHQGNYAPVEEAIPVH
ncbi:penicillin-binding protein 1B [Gallibacterium trehalosifermentans]|uniref:Penicillin-binding protein 1B n=1 Tax=Gallibacterium trehalosifermentans TaxID=516935 RepID=A0ABV6GYR3_9PAST